MPTNPLRLFALIMVAACPLLPRVAQAAWPHDPNGNVPLCNAIRLQSLPAITSDGAGGAIVAWQDQRYEINGSDVFAQRVDVNGVPRWTTDGVPVAVTANSQFVVATASDGAGGAILAWQDTRSGSAAIYAQHLNANGVPQWTANGVVVSTGPADEYTTGIVEDGAGGAIITWVDGRNGTWDIYAQRVNSSGATQWTANGVVVCNAANTQANPVIASDGAGGAVLTWEDSRSGTTDVYAQRVNASGAALWTGNGVVVCNATGGQVSPKIISDGSGGAIVTWQDYRVTNSHIYAQRVLAGGAVAWTGNGAVVCAAQYDQISPALSSDGANGAIVTWSDGRSASSWDIYSQRMNSAGVALWTANGVAVCTLTGDQLFPAIIPDGIGGAVIAWGDSRAGQDVYGQRINATGVPLWSGNGIAITTATGSQSSPILVPDNTGGAIAAWTDTRNGTPNLQDIYTQKIERFGYLGDPAPVIAGVGDIPNDQGGRVKVSWYASWLDPVSDPNLYSYDIYCSVPGSVARDAVRRGARISSSFAEPPRPGETSFVIEPASVQLYAWQYVGSSAPVHFVGAYGYVASTTGDSIAGSNPRSVFMVVARNAGGSMYWLSSPDSGYSVDNLAPATPAPFVGHWSSGTVALHWNPNSEGDLSGYRIYRGTSSGFVPDASNRIAMLADTGYVDHAGAPYYYKLSAVDAHGNESGFALYTPIGSTDVSTAGLPEVVRLAAPEPNPAVYGSRFALELPQTTTIQLVVHDAAGRAVRALARGSHQAGRFEFAWDLRDDSGRAVPAGLYFVRLVVPGASLTRKLAVTR